ncbi:arginine/ornithine antiporter [Vibrio halioticoli NBRC 102217]|uniref:Arginine/ornithine antiporter n=1 Tax=Vibrio halioticoli NBRC 102217 TaxID=1219072 RepID=V5FLF5_9VIBR|nr:basic amino acid/polyamine antiporter [Vibrio halioticoli]GAD90491.1 arginine/ornithine antiporter [Vibrio halioticoli NBRC 102217]
MNKTNSVGLVGLIAIVFGSMIGSGIFSIPQNMAEQASIGAVSLAWLITGIGMLLLVQTFRILAEHKPNLNSGIFTYAREGFGEYIGFQSAWGYWLMSCMGNVALTVMINDSLGLFFPVLLEHGIETVILCSALLWGMNTIALRGAASSSFINVISTVGKLIGLAVIIGIILYSFEPEKLSIDVWGQQQHLGSVMGQIQSTMMVTLWCFVGIEGAVVLSGRARNKSDVGKATLIGFLVAISMYTLIAVLSFGILPQQELAQLPNPSTASLLEVAIGPFGRILVNICVLVSVFGALIAWTMLVAEVPYEAGKAGEFPKFFSRTNKNDAPKNALSVSTIFMQLCVLLVVMFENVYLAAINIASVMVLPCYLLSCLYLLKLSWNYHEVNLAKRNYGHVLLAAVAALFCAWLITAAGLEYQLMATILYTIGIPFFRYTHAARLKAGEKVYSAMDKWIERILIVLALVSIYLMVTGHLHA